MTLPIHWISKTTSTNSAVIEIAKEKKLNSLVLVADHQTEGRGQFGRKWLSQPGENLLFSIYFRPKIKPSEAAALTQITCQAVIAVLSDHKISCTIKLPNDILVQGKKICGILTESSSSGEKLEHIVVGIGLNVNSCQESLLEEATSVQIETKKVQDRKIILENILKEFKVMVSSHFNVDFDQLVEL